MAEICPTTFKLEKLLLSTDGSEYSEGAIREAIKLAKKCPSMLTVISVIETNPEFEALAPSIVEQTGKTVREHQEAIQTRAQREGVHCDLVAHQSDEAYAAIVEEAAARKTDLIIMGRRGRTGLKRLMMGSVTARVIGHAPCNVLVVPRAATMECKNLLVATDGSRNAAIAVAEAIGMAKRCGSKLTILSVVPSESISPMDIVHSQMQRDHIATRELRQAEQAVKAAKEAAQQEGIAAEGLILGGKPYEAIVQTAKEKSVDLIILGSLGKSGMAKLLIGSVAERVIVLSPAAVLVVKTR